jgi:hypothetical protein
MEENNSKFNLTDFIEKHLSKLKFLEIISILIFIIGLILLASNNPDLNIIFITGCILLGITYFFFAYSVVDFENLEPTGVLNSFGMILFLYKLNYLSLAVASVAMLGLVIDFPNGNPLLVISSFTLIIILIISLITQVNDRSKIYNLIFYLRIIICLVLLSFLGLIEYNILK